MYIHTCSTPTMVPMQCFAESGKSTQKQHQRDWFYGKGGNLVVPSSLFGGNITRAYLHTTVVNDHRVELNVWIVLSHRCTLSEKQAIGQFPATERKREGGREGREGGREGWREGEEREGWRDGGTERVHT